MTEIKPLTYKNMHGEITLHPCSTRDENGQIVPMTTTGGYQLYAMPGGAKHTERKLDVIMWDKYGRAKRQGGKDPKAVTLENGAIKWVFEHHLEKGL